MIYLDHNATTPVDPQVIEAMQECLKVNFGNPSSLHTLGRRARQCLEDARDTLAQFLNVASDEIFFTSGGTESINVALRGFFKKNKFNTFKPHVISTTVEHKSVLETLSSMQESGVIDLSLVGVDHLGRLSLDDFEKARRPETVLISVMWVNNEIGNIYPIDKLSHWAKSHKITFHVDAVQALGKIPTNLSQIQADLVSFSAHKIYGPKGVGALYIKSGVKIAPLITGGAQEMEKRGGTENLPGIAGFARAIKLLPDLHRAQPQIEKLRNQLQEGLQLQPGACVQGDQTARVAQTLSMTFEGLDSEMGIIALDREGIAVSSGSACASGAVEPSHVLLAMGVDKAQAKGVIRFSLGKSTREADIEKVLEIFPDVLSRLRTREKDR